jgi:hypothetical protein
MEVLLNKCEMNYDCMCVYVGDLQTVLLKAKITVTVRPMFGWVTARDIHILMVIFLLLGAVMCTVQYPLYSSNVLLCNEVHGAVYIIQQ